ncbi:MAG: TolC family protein [Kiritimatiellia bacterium]|nr:TolC family protein [Kiritimatiellia bacterium]
MSHTCKPWISGIRIGPTATGWRAGWIALILAGSALADSAPARLTVEAAFEAALQNNLRLAGAALDVRRRSLDLELAKSAFDASFSPFARVSAPDGERQFSYGLQISKPLSSGGAIGAVATRFDGPETREGLLSLDLTQPLFRRFGRNVAEEAIRTGSDRLRSSRRLWESRKADLALTLVSLFETIFRLDAQAEFERRFLGELDRLARLTRARERQGRATRMDSLRVEVQLGEAQTRLTNVQERRAIAMRELTEVVGADPSENLLLAPPPRIVTPLPDPETAVALALSRRMDYAQVLDDAASAGRRDTLARRARWPDLSLSLSLRRTHPDGLPEAAREGENHWFATLASDGFPSRRADRIAMEQAGLDEESAELEVEWTRQIITREVLQALAECRRAEAELEIAERTREWAQNGSTLGRRLYALGRTDGLSVSGAEAQLAESERRLLEAQAADRFSRVALLHVLGLLIEHPEELTPEAPRTVQP